MATKSQKNQTRQQLRTLIIVALVLVIAVAAVLLFTGKKGAAGTYYVAIDVQDYGTITAELYGDVAPITVENFLNLADEHFYDGLTSTASFPVS